MKKANDSLIFTGKSYVFGSLADLFMAVGYVRPTPGYTFNFDNCVGKQIMMCEEFSVSKSDSNTMETIKDILSGNPTLIKVKHREALLLKPVPWLFFSNYANFDYQAQRITALVENIKTRTF